MSKRGENTLVTLWVPDNVLSRWDQFAEDFGLKRTGLIITSVNEFIERNKIGTAPQLNHELKQNVQEIRSILQKNIVEKPVENLSKVRSQILEILNGRSADFDTLAFILGRDSFDIANIIQALNKEGKVAIDAEGNVHASSK